jgi:predicted translin family RNA/ssDNA-binding protein
MPDSIELIRSINLKIPARMVETAEKVGEGNYTEGFRRIVDFYEQSNDLDLPDWFFSSSWELKDIHKLIRMAGHIGNKGKLVRDIWRKGDTRVRALLLDICREDSFLYLEWVKNALSDLINFEDEKKEWQALRKKLENAKDEIDKAEETITHLNEEISKLEEKKAGIEAEIKQYNDDMLKIITFKPIDALLTLYKALTDIVDYMDATDPAKAKLRNARDLAGKLVQHIDHFSGPDLLTAEVKAKLELSESIRKIEDKDVRKLFHKLLKKLTDIKPANTFDIGLLENAGYFALDPNTYYDIDELAGKISGVLEEVKK